MKRLYFYLLPLFTLVVLFGGLRLANGTVDPLGPYLQTWHASDLTSLSAQTGARSGMTAWVDNTGSGTGARFTAVPSATFALNSPHVVAGQNSVRWADDSVIVGTIAIGNLPTVSNTTAGVVPSVGAADTLLRSTGTAAAWTAMTSGMHGAQTVGTLHAVANGTTAGFCPALGTANRVLGTTDGSTLTLLQISDAMIGVSAAISLSKLETCTANQVLSSNGTTDACTNFNDTIHGSRGGGTLHSNVTTTTAGFAPSPTLDNSALVRVGTNIFWSPIADIVIDAAAAINVNKLFAGGAANRVVGTTNGTTMGMVQVNDSMVSDLTWGKLTGIPTINTSAPLTGGGVFTSSLTLAISPATTSQPGSLSAADKAKIDSHGQTHVTDLDLGVGSDLIPLVTSRTSGIVPNSANSNNQVLLMLGNVATWGKPTHNQIDSAAGITPTQLSLGGANQGIISNGTGNSWGSIVGGSGTSGTIPKFTASGTIGDSPITVAASAAVAIGAANWGSAYTVGNAWTRSYQGTSYWNGANWITPAPAGTNEVSSVGFYDTGISFYLASSTGSSPRTDSSATFLAYEKARIDMSGNLTIAGQLKVSGGSPGTGKVMVSDSAGLGSWSSAVPVASLAVGTSGCVVQSTGSTMMCGTPYVDWSHIDNIGSTAIQFGSTVAAPQITQETPASGVTAINNMAAIAQSCNSATASCNGGDYSVCSGAPGIAGSGGTVYIKGNCVNGGDNGAILADFSQSSGLSRFRTAVVEHNYPASGENHILSSAAGFAVTEDIKWFQVVQAGTGQITRDITISSDGTYQIDLEVTAKGGTIYGSHTRYYASRASSAWVSNVNQAITTQCSPACSPFVGFPNATTIRVAVTPGNATSTTWTLKVTYRVS